MTHYKQCCARECPHCAEGSIREYHSFGDGPLHPVKGGWASCTAPTLSVFAERCAEALKVLVEALPDKCSCHEAYTEREKNLGYRFKDPNCMFCEYEDEIRAARRALGLEKG